MSKVLEDCLDRRQVRAANASERDPGGDAYVSKCGVETRPATGKMAKYQGFWYAPLEGGLDGARKVYKEVLDRLMRDSIVAPVELVLKRGCTEMEHQWSPSDKWDEYAERYRWDRDEGLCNSVFWPKFEFGKEPMIFEIHVIKKWIEHAAVYNDPTVGKFKETDLLKGVLRYEKSYHAGKDYTGLEVGEGGQASDCKEEGKMLDVRGSSYECGVQGSKLTVIH